MSMSTRSLIPKAIKWVSKIKWVRRTKMFFSKKDNQFKIPHYKTNCLHSN